MAIVSCHSNRGGGRAAVGGAHILQFGSGHLQLVQTLQKHPLPLLLHVLVGSLLGGREGGREEGGREGGRGGREGGGREGGREGGEGGRDGGRR